VALQSSGCNALSITSPAVDEKRMRTGQWLGLVLYLPFSALRLMSGWQNICPSKNPFHYYYYYYYYYYIHLTAFFSRTTWVSRQQKGK